MGITAKKLILGLLLVSDGRPIPVRQLIDACEIFAIRENNVRVTLVRLSASGLIQASSRGTYVLGRSAQNLASQVATWQTMEQQLSPWHGGYIVAHLGALGRSDRKALRQRERALAMCGMQPLDSSLYLRPDNLENGVSMIRRRLHALGLEPEAPVFGALDFAPEHAEKMSALWPTVALNLHYQEQRQQLEDWLQRCDELEPEAAAREVYIRGAEAVRSLVFDPWLPAPMIDEHARHRYVETVRRFDETGKALWRRLYHITIGMPYIADSPLTSGVLQ